MITKIEMLFIRACKSREPFKRAKSVYKRFYCRTCEGDDANVMLLLSDIVEKYKKGFRFFHFLSELSPNSVRSQYGYCKMPYWERVTHLLINEFRFMNVENLVEIGYIVPCKWKNKGEREC